MPFLIDTDGGAAKVAADREVAAAVQVGLSRLALTGLGLVAEGLYRPFGYLKPLETPSDFRGIEIRAPRSAAIRTALRALDARPVPLGSVTAGAAGSGRLPPGRRGGEQQQHLPARRVHGCEPGCPRRHRRDRRLEQRPRLTPGRPTPRTDGRRRRYTAWCRRCNRGRRRRAGPTAVQGGTVVNADASERRALQQATARALPGSRSLVLRIATLATGGSPACAGAIPAPFPRFEGRRRCGCETGCSCRKGRIGTSFRRRRRRDAEASPRCRSRAR